MLKLGNITFPLYKLRAYLDIDTNLLGVTRITTIKGVYIFDDYTLRGDFEERRANLSLHYPDENIYKLKERVIYLRQLIKYKSGTTFVDHTGKLIKYAKSTKLFKIKSKEITRTREHGNWTVVDVRGHEQPFVVGQVLLSTTKYASIMETQWGPLLYDLTSKQHEIYRRKI